MKDYENAVKNYLFSLQISTAIGFKKGAADAYENIGNVYTEQGYSEKSMNNYNAALLIYKEIGYKNGVAACNNGIGYVKYKQGLYSDALKNFTVSLDEYTEIQYKAGIALAYLNLGRTTLRLKNYNAAEKHLNTGLSLSKEMRSREYIRDSFKELSFLDSTQGKWHDAFLNHRMYALYNDSLSDEENIKKTVQAQMQYQFDKKESTTKAEQEKKDAIAKQELEKQKLIRNSITGGAGILGFSGIFSFFFYKRKRDAEQKQKETFLSLQVSETEMKALRSQMNPHFIFNALQSIQTFLLSHKSEEANLYLLKFSKLMRAVLENSQHSEVSLKDDMQALELYMQLESIRLTHPFTYQFHIDESVDTESDSIPPLILQPFVENAIWHGLQYKKEAGHINIFISKKNNALYATVEDNGVGRDMSKQVAQPMLLKKESLGMKLTEERLKVLNEVKKFNAHFTITDLFTKENKPAGTKIELSLPLVA
jgi:tetratricopeptide (TPR) repeat protein